MKCINKIVKYSFCMLAATIFLAGCKKPEPAVTQYETEQYNKSLYTAELFAAELCVTKDNIELNNYPTDPTLHAAGLFGVNQKQVYYANNVHERLFPASTTKVMTAYLALKYGTLTDVVSVSAHATTELDPASSVANLAEGDQVTLEALIYGLMHPSGNDSAIAIAEYISGSEEAFVELMNQEARLLGATNSHFMNSHGLQDENHYTTAYDLYLIFNECLKDERFLTILGAASYTASITGADGVVRSVTWEPSNHYAQGTAIMPPNVTLAGGKTGTTNEAGSCLMLLLRDASSNPYISIVMGGSSKDVLYSDMTALIGALPAS